MKVTEKSGAGANLAVRGKIPPKPPFVPESGRFRRSEVFGHYSISAKLAILHHAQDCVERCGVVGSAKCDSKEERNMTFRRVHSRARHASLAVES
jgi:hypothetical protein